MMRHSLNKFGFLAIAGICVAAATTLLIAVAHAQDSSKNPYYEKTLKAGTKKTIELADFLKQNKILIDFAMSRADWAAPLEADLRKYAADMAHAPNWDHHAAIPTRVGATNAERTFFVRSLAKFFVDNTGDARIAIVAPTVSTILDLPNPIDVNHAEKLVGGMF